MNATELYNRGITLDENGIAKGIEAVDSWWNADVSHDMLIYKIGDSLCCAYGWNGESFTESFRVVDRFTADGNAKFELQPIYRWQFEEREYGEDNDSDSEIVGFEIR